MEFTNKTVVITGAGSGIGAAAAILFAQKGAHVVVSDILIESAQQIATQIGQMALAQQTDVTDFEQVQQLMQLGFGINGRLDVLVNNAGIGPKQLLKTADHTLDDWQNVVAVNQTGVFYGMKSALSIMAKQGIGNIVNVASLAGLKASGNNISYAASKFAVVGMTKSAALEYAKKNISINAVCPAYTETALLNQLWELKPEMRELLRAQIPMGRFGGVQEMAEAICWLASDQTGFITGQTLTLDGGASL